jgi:hypothetical protein
MRIAALVLAASLFPGQEPTTDEAFPKATPLEGDVRVWKGKARRTEKLAAPARIAPHDRLGVGDAGAARLHVEPDVLLTLRGVEAGPEGGLSLALSEKRLALRLYRGHALVESFEADVAVETDHGKAEGKSVSFLVEATREGTRIVPLDGKLKVTTDLGTLEVGAGEAAALRKGKAPARGAASGEAEAGWALAAEAAGNYFRNPGFEDGLNSWYALRLKGKAIAHADLNAARAGRKSLRLDFAGVALKDMSSDSPDNDQNSCVVYQKAQTDWPSARCLLRFWVRTERLTVDGREAPVAVGLNNETVEVAPTGGQWRCVRTVRKIAPGGFFIWRAPWAPGESGAARLQGSIWIDDVYLAVLPEAPAAGTK